MIVLENISKRFKLYSKPSDRLREILFRKPRHTEYQALEGISFNVPNGQTLGIIGPNGAGKSTILKILMGVILPDTGRIETSGKVTGLLELGTGFNAEMSGLENISMNGLLLGMSKDEINERKEAIIEFSELGDFIQEPIKTYSSGMVMRLAFSIAINARPSCFVVDEALSVGDAHFSQKCMRAIREFRENGGSIIFVSHDLNAVKMLCDQAILLNRGRVIASGVPEDVVNAYNHLLALLSGKDSGVRLQNVGKKTSYGNMEAVIESVSVRGRDSGADVVSSGEETEVVVTFRATKNIPDLTVGIMIRDHFGQDIFGTNTYHHKIPCVIEPNAAYVCAFSMPMAIAPGKYTVTAALHTGAAHNENCYNWKDGVADFVVAGIRGHIFAGVVALNTVIRLSRAEESACSLNTEASRSCER